MLSVKCETILFYAGGFLHIDVLAYNDVEELDFAGPYEVLGKLTECEDVSLHVVALTPVVCCRHGLCIERNKRVREKPGEILVVPGGRGARTPSEERHILADYIFCTYESRMYLLSVCTGTFLLAEAGILSGKTVTTHRNYLSQLEGNVIDYRVVKDGNVITCQGVTSGIDAALFLVSLLYGRELAQKIAERMEHLLSVEHICDMTYIVGEG